MPSCLRVKRGQDFGIVPTKTLPYTSFKGQIGWPNYGQLYGIKRQVALGDCDDELGQR